MSRITSLTGGGLFYLPREVAAQMSDLGKSDRRPAADSCVTESVMTPTECRRPVGRMTVTAEAFGRKLTTAEDSRALMGLPERGRKAVLS